MDRQKGQEAGQDFQGQVLGQVFHLLLPISEKEFMRKNDGFGIWKEKLLRRSVNVLAESTRKMGEMLAEKEGSAKAEATESTVENAASTESVITESTETDSQTDSHSEATDEPDTKKPVTNKPNTNKPAARRKDDTNKPDTNKPARRGNAASANNVAHRKRRNSANSTSLLQDPKDSKAPKIKSNRDTSLLKDPTDLKAPKIKSNRDPGADGELAEWLDTGFFESLSKQRVILSPASPIKPSAPGKTVNAKVNPDNKKVNPDTHKSRVKTTAGSSPSQDGNFTKKDAASPRALAEIDALPTALAAHKFRNNMINAIKKPDSEKSNKTTDKTTDLISAVKAPERLVKKKSVRISVNEMEHVPGEASPEEAEEVVEEEGVEEPAEEEEAVEQVPTPSSGGWLSRLNFWGEGAHEDSENVANSETSEK